MTNLIQIIATFTALFAILRILAEFYLRLPRKSERTIFDVYVPRDKK